MTVTETSSTLQKSERLHYSATVTLLYKETAQKVDIEAIDALCGLFGCEVGDILAHVPSKAAK